MRLDNSGLLIGGCFLLRLAEFFDESHGTALETPLEASAGTGVDELSIAEVGSMIGVCLMNV
jgi:hypothetical protein